MYLLNQELAVNWILYSDIAPPSLAEVTISKYSPDAKRVTLLPIEPVDYTAPTANTFGFITYRFTPTLTGRYKILLYIGAILIHTRNILVSEPDTSIDRFVNATLL